MADRKKPINPVAAAVTGAIVGGVAAAGAMALSDEKNREKIKDAFSNAKNRSMDYVANAKQAAVDRKEEIAERLVEAREDAIDKAESIKNVITEE